MTGPLERLGALLREEGGPLAATASAAPGADSPLGDAVAGGPRAAQAPEDYALVVEAVREGYELHYGRPRVVITADRDLGLLAGDRLYALGLARLAERGDLEAVGALARVIDRCAVAHASGEPGRAESAWQAGVRAVGWGPPEVPASDMVPPRSRT